MKDQNQLMDVYLDRLFQKYNITPDKVDLSPDQKEKVRNIVENIQADVEKFLVNTNKAVTENDMPQQTEVIETNDNIENSFETFSVTEEPKTKPKVYVRGGGSRKRKKKVKIVMLLDCFVQTNCVFSHTVLTRK